MVEPDAFTVGEDLAVTPGAVVPQRGVRTHPVHTSNREGVDGALLMVPPVINKFYILDIAAGRSMVEPWCAKATRCSLSRGVIQRGAM